MSNVVEDFETRRNRAALEKRFEQIRATGMAIVIREDHGSWAVVDVIDAEDENKVWAEVLIHNLIVDPSGVSPESRARAARRGAA